MVAKTFFSLSPKRDDLPAAGRMTAMRDMTWSLPVALHHSKFAPGANSLPLVQLPPAGLVFAHCSCTAAPVPQPRTNKERWDMNKARTTAVGVFEDRRHAHLAIDELCRAGFTLDQIGMILPEGGPIVDQPNLEEHTRATEGAAAGAVAGSTLGALAGAAAAVFIPGIGPVLAGGLLAGALVGATAGMAGGGVLGALIGLSIPEEEARHHEERLRSGWTLVTV